MSIKRLCFTGCGLFLLIIWAFAAVPLGPPAARSQALPLDTATATPTLTAGPSCLMVTGSTPRCYWPDRLNYYFAFYNSCNTGLNGSGVVQLEVAPTSSGPWTVFDQANVTQSFPPGSSYASGNFIENNIPSEYHFYRFSIVINASNGQTLNGTTTYAPLCNTPGPPSPTPTGITIQCYMGATGAQSTCSQPSTYTYDFGIYSHCDTTMPGTVQVQFQAGPAQGGPWTTFVTQTSSRTFIPGANSVQGTFVGPGIPSNYSWYRIAMSASYPGPFGNRYVTNETQPAIICAPTVTATPTPTITSGPTSTPTIGPPCGIINVSGPGTTYCTSPSDYYYSFTFYVESGCPQSMSGIANVVFNVAPDSSGPWTTYDSRSYPVTFYRGYAGNSGTFHEAGIPSQYRWYKIDFSATFPNNAHANNSTTPASLCDLPTGTPSGTVTATPTPCGDNYTYAVTTGTIISGTTLLAGSQCGTCTVNLALPFPFNFYGQTYTNANVSTQGNLQFATSYLGPNTCPLPDVQLGPAMMPHWDEWLGTSFHPPCEAAMGTPCGIYTSMSGVAPNRIFNIEWRAQFVSTSQHTANFEIRLYEQSSYFEFIYGWVSYTGGGASIGVQDGSCRFTSYSCNTWYNIQPGTRISWGMAPPNGSPTPATSTPEATPSATQTPPVCTGNYIIATATATIVLGTNDTGNHCDDCYSQVSLPFPYELYDRTFSSVTLDSNGRAIFTTPGPIFPVACFPQPGATYTIYPYWDDLDTEGGGRGIYTSVSGTSPNRIFNIEWRAQYYPSIGSVNFEIRLYEGQSRFDVIYGLVSGGTSVSLSGVEKDESYFTQYFCDGQGGDANNGRLVIYSMPLCITATAVPPTATLQATSTVEPCTITFSDVDTNNTFYASIRCLACSGIVSGYSDGTFRPNTQVTRGQLAKMVSNAAGFSEVPSGQTFQDVPPTHTFYEFIQRLTIRGYMTGYPCGGSGEPCINNRPYFRPQNNATRGQTSKIVASAAQIETPIPPDRQTFEDVPPTHTFWLWIERLAARNIMGGYPCGGPGEPCLSGKPYFRPGNDVTRGQASKIVANSFYPQCTALAKP